MMASIGMFSVSCSPPFLFAFLNKKTHFPGLLYFPGRVVVTAQYRVKHSLFCVCEVGGRQGLKKTNPFGSSVGEVCLQCSMLCELPELTCVIAGQGGTSMFYTGNK